MIERYCRFQSAGTIAHGVVEGDSVVEIDGDPFGTWKRKTTVHKLSDVGLLAPCQPRQVFALAGNYKSHLGGDDVVTTVVTTTKVVVPASGEPRSETRTTTDIVQPGQVPEKFRIPQIFLKSPSCIIGTEDEIVIPPGTKDVHYEGEMVVVIGTAARNVDEQDALKHVLGVTCGNDVSARDWQKSDVQWWRAKGSDTFGPIGPFLVSGLNYDNLRIQLRVNGRTVQDCNTKELIHGTAKAIAFISRHVALLPGDAIFTGTSATTTAIVPGDVVEVEIDGIGVLRNRVAGPK